MIYFTLCFPKEIKTRRKRVLALKPEQPTVQDE